MSSSDSNLLQDFYVPCMNHAKRFDRAAGYFSSAIFALAPLAYADFFERGGKIRLVSSTQLTLNDAKALSEAGPGESMDSLIAEFKKIAADPHSPFHLLSRILSSLIHSGALEMKFARPTSGAGVFHDKYGVFENASGDRVSFIGSANETAFAWSGRHNHEKIEIFRSWNRHDARRIDDHTSSFDAIWANELKGYEVKESRQFEKTLIELLPPEPIQSLLIELRLKEGASASLKDAESQQTYSLRHYQAAALENWRNLGRRGVISFATGGGKTLTAIDAIKAWLPEGPAIVMVPSSLLLSQWHAELKSWIPEASILQVGGGSPKSRWSQALYRFTQRDGSKPRIVLSTYASAASADFRHRVDAGSHIMVVGDEVHKFGSKQTRSIADWLDAGPRLGLSATPMRRGDEEGTNAIFSFFGDTVKPVYSLKEAIADGVLVPYDYFISMAPLSETELDEWDELSTRISRELAMNDGRLTDKARKLSIRRARISKRAESKAEIAAKLVHQNMEHGDRWLVYCESVSHLSEVRAAMERALGKSVTLMEFHSKNMQEHERVINFFETKGGVVLAIKCLDEGVDIPIINKAIILSSSSNPREFVQRRGRVLRRHPAKRLAQIWDLVSVRSDGRPIAGSELLRASEFADSSNNQAVKFQLSLMSDTFGTILNVDR